MSTSSHRWRRLFTAALLAAGSSVLDESANTTAALAVPLPSSDFQQVQLALGSAEIGEGMSLAVMPDRSVLHTARDGTLRVTNAAGNTKSAGKLTVYTHDEEGLQGVQVDPGFATNRWVWLYYSPALSTPGGDAPETGNDATFAPWKGHLRLSRFTLKTDNTLDFASEKIVLTVANDRGLCCHVGGDIDFDAAGNLYLTTGDDTNPFQSANYSPIDERTNRNPQFDAQRSSANTNDLRGKLLRIKPQTDGTYTIPGGNLFAPGTAMTRPEIYAMGFRNPFRMSVDRATGVVYLGDYGPDAGSTMANRGPAGQVEFNRITGPGNYGWPYCTGLNTSNETYNEWNFATNATGPKFNCGGNPTNNSFRNTGQGTLPVPKASWIRYGGDAGTPSEFGSSGSESPMGGPVYRFDASLGSAVKFPQSLDANFFAGEYGRKWIKPVKINSDGTRGEISSLPWTGNQVMDMAFGPEGALYVLDYGTGSNNQGLYRIEFIGGGNRAPIAKITPDKTSGPSPLTVNFSSTGSTDPDGGALTYAWDFDGNGTVDSTATNPSFTYTTNGTKTPTLTVRDPQGATGSASTVITVGNTAPTVTVALPRDGQLFSFGNTVTFQLSATDAEDGTTINCTRAKMTYLLGHDQHIHQITSQNGCTGSIAVPAEGEHDVSANLYGVFDAEYTDAGGLTTHVTRTLQPRHRQAEHFTTMSGVDFATHTAAEGGRTVGFINNGDWISFNPYVLANATSCSFRASSAGAGGIVEVRTGSQTGTLLGTANIPITGSWETFTNVSANLSNVPQAPAPLFLVFKGGTGSLFDLDAFTFTTTGGNWVEAESFSSTVGVQVASHGPASAGSTAGFINNGDSVTYSAVNTSGAKHFSAVIASAGVGGTIQVRSGSATGTLLGSVTVPITGSWEVYRTVSVSLTGSASGQVVLVFTGGSGSLFDVDRFNLGK